MEYRHFQRTVSSITANMFVYDCAIAGQTMATGAISVNPRVRDNRCQF